MNADDTGPSGLLAHDEYECKICRSIDRWDACDAEAVEPDYCEDCESCLWALRDEIKLFELEQGRAATVRDLRLILEAHLA